MSLFFNAVDTRFVWMERSKVYVVKGPNKVDTF